MKFITTMDEPLTPLGRMFMHPKIDLVVNCAIGLKNPINIESIKKALINSFIIKHPRFSSLLIVDERGRGCWRKTQVNIDDHVIVHRPNNPNSDNDNDNDNNNDNNNEERREERINEILSDFAVSSPLSMKKPLWEMHIICELNCFIFRFHHALGDGTAVMSLFLASCKRFDGKDDKNEKGIEKKKEKNWRKKGFSKGILKMVWWTTISIVGLAKSLCISDTKTAVSGGDGVELWPRILASAKFNFEDMRTVKRAIPGVTINDVLFGVLSFGFSKYLVHRSSDGLRKGLKITGLAMVNLRKQPGLQEISKLEEKEFKRGRWGNRFGVVLLPVYCQTKDPEPLNYVKRAKKMMDRKKQSWEAPFSYFMSKLIMSLFGPKVSSMVNYRILCNTTFMISNVVGSQGESLIDDNPITYIRPTSSSLPQAIIMHMMTYNGMANIQILVAKDIIPDPQVLAKCFEDAMLEIKNAAILI